MGNYVLDSLQHQSEVIKPENIKVNLNGNVADRGKIIPRKEKDNVYHRTIVKSKLPYNHQSYRGHLGEFECNETSDAEVLKPSDINFILYYTTAASQAESKAAAAA
jgi:hypothetical protein